MHPTESQVEAALLDVVRAQPGIVADQMDAAVLDRLGCEPDDGLAAKVLAEVTARLLEDDGPLVMLSGDRVLHAPECGRSSVLTHRVSAEERRAGGLEAGFDLGCFIRRDDLHLADGTRLEAVFDEDEGVGWAGPPGWLDQIPEESLAAVRVADDGLVTVELLTEEPTVDDVLVARLRAVYDAEVAQAQLPVRGEELAFGLLLEDPRTFDRPLAPLAALAEAAGLERRGDRVAHQGGVWEHERKLQRAARVADVLDDDGALIAVRRALDAAEDPEAPVERLASVLDDLADPELAQVLADELIPTDDAHPDDVAVAAGFAERLVAVANRPARAAVAHWLSALVAERSGDVLGADAELRLGLRLSPDWEPLLARAAWYASDRGDAPSALRLWRRLPNAHPEDLRLSAHFAGEDAPKVGRNDSCWCGSGRKYKSCHQGRAPVFTLAERCPWLWRKAAAYLERRGGLAGEQLFELVDLVAADPDDDETLLAALDVPLVADAALVEGGWFGRFLIERGALLPGDEAELARSWVEVPRSVYQVTDERPDAFATVRDLRTGETGEVGVAGRPVTTGTLLCARAVPDGQGRQFMGAVVEIPPGEEAAVLELCDRADPAALCRRLASG